MKKIRYTLTLALISLMFFAAAMLKNNAVIFPELFALLIGLVCTDRLPWKTDNLHTVILVTISALAGYAISAYVPFPIYFKLLLGLAVPGIIIILSDCTLMPCAAVSLIPICTGITSPTYPIAAFAWTAAVLVIREYLIYKNNKEAAYKFHYTPDFGYDLKLWLKIMIFFAIVSAIATVVFSVFGKYIPLIGKDEMLYLVSPPLAVLLVEGSYRNLYGRRMKIWFVITVSAVIGAMFKFIGTDLFGLPMFISGTIAAAAVLLEMRLMNIMFPPIAAAALMPFITGGDIFFYPPIVSLMSGIILIFTSSARKNKH